MVKAIVNMRSFRMVLMVIASIVFIRLTISSIHSGYSYTFDNDEMNHTQITYLLGNNYKPYTDIYLTVYPPVYHTLLLPIFARHGYSFDAMYIARKAMILLFILRLAVASIIAYLLFGWFAAILYLFLAQFNAFAIFAEMQIRPDNLMVTLFEIGILLSLLAHKKNSLSLHVFSACTITWSTLVLLKSAPGSLAFFGISAAYFFFTKNPKKIYALGIGAISAIVLFCFPFILAGSFHEMIKQLVVEAMASYSGVFEYPIPLGFFYHPRNPALYGLHGKPATFMYAWVLPLLAFSGLFALFGRIATARITESYQRVILLVLGASLIGQWVFLFFMESVFIQHYIPVNWLLTVFAVFCICIFFEEIKKYRMGSRIAAVLLACTLLVLVRSSVRGNEARAARNASELIAWWENTWKLIPPDAPVFPNLLFRPLAYPVPYGHFIGNIPESILNRLPSIPDSLEQKKTQFVYIDDYYLARLRPDVATYITTHYTRQPQSDLYLRK